MRFILGLIGVMFALDALWWAASVRLAKPAATRLALALFTVAQMAGLVWLITRRFSPASAALFPKFALAAVFIFYCSQLCYCQFSPSQYLSAPRGERDRRLLLQLQPKRAEH
jgi:hypothetical protein